MINLRLPNGDVIQFPDGTPEEEMRRVASEYLGESGTEDRGLGGAASRGFWGGMSEAPAWLGGTAGLVEDIIPGKQESIESIEQGLKGFAERVRARGGPGQADTLAEKVVEGVSAAPGTIAAMGPALLGAAAALPASAPAALVGATGLGAYGLTRAGGEGLGPAAMEGLKGAAEGAAFGGVGAAAGRVAKPALGRLLHAAGAGGIGAGSAALSGGDTEDVLAHGATLGILGGIMPQGKKGRKLTQEDIDAWARGERVQRPEGPLAELEAAAERIGIGKIEDRYQVLGEARDALGDPTFLAKPKPTKAQLEEGVPRQKAVNLEQIPDLGTRQYVDQEISKLFQNKDPKTLADMTAEGTRIAARLGEKGIRNLGADIKDVAELGGRARLARQFVQEGVNKIRGWNQLLEEARQRGVPEEQLKILETKKKYEVKVNNEKVLNSLRFGSELGRGMRALGDAPQTMVERAIKYANKNDAYSEQFFEALAKVADNPEGIFKVVHGFVKPKLRHYVAEIAYGSLLSNPLTWLVNDSSNAAFAAALMAERAGAVPADIARVGIGRALGKNVARERPVSDIYADIMGAKRGLVPAWKEMLRGLRDETYGLEITKHEFTNLALPGTPGKIARFPMRFLKARDLFYRTFSEIREMNVQAHRKALSELGKGADARKVGERTAEILKNIEDYPEIAKAARQYGRVATFTNETRAALRGIMNLRDINQRGGINTAIGMAMRAIFPFVRTPWNIAEQAVQRTPLGVFSLKGKAGGELSDQVAKVAMGSTAVIIAGLAAKEGLLTGGGPLDYKERQALMQTGWRPYSLKIPGKFLEGGKDVYLPYNRIEPFATIIGGAVDLANISDVDSEERLNAIVRAATNNLTDKTFLYGVENLANLLSDPDRHAAQVVANYTNFFVPAIVRGSARAMDPYFREYEGVGSRVAAGIPGLSQTLPIRRSITGKPVEREETAVGRLLSGLPIPTKEKPNTQLEREMVRLGYVPGQFREEKTIGNQKIKMTPQEKMMMHQANRQAAALLERMVQSPGWRYMSDEQKKEMISKIYSQARAGARSMVNPMMQMRAWQGVQ